MSKYKCEKPHKPGAALGYLRNLINTMVRSPSDTPDVAVLNARAIRYMILIGSVGLALIIVDLIASWNMTGIEIQHDEKSDRIYLIRPDKDGSAEHLALKARVRAEQGSYEKNLDLTLSPYRDREEAEPEKTLTDDSATEEERVMYELRAIASDMDSDRSRKKITLPTTLPGGGDITWTHRRQSHTLLLVLLIMATCAFVYKRRLLPLHKKKKDESVSILDCLPGFIHQLVLLMNAGLVLSRAFERAVVENMKFREEESRFFYIRISDIYESMSETNGSLTSELREFAGESGVGELMRVSSIISDNADKGTELIEKLERESRSLWLGRKHRSEERGRLAETKMTLPLSIFLGVLILITVSPALLEL